MKFSVLIKKENEEISFDDWLSVLGSSNVFRVEPESIPFESSEKNQYIDSPISESASFLSNGEWIKCIERNIDGEIHVCSKSSEISKLLLPELEKLAVEFNAKLIVLKNEA